MHENISHIPLTYVKTECRNVRPEKAALHTLWVQKNEYRADYFHFMYGLFNDALNISNHTA